MKTIKERAKEYATIMSENPDPLRPGDATRVAMRVDKHLAEAFIAGAESEHAELTRWNDPKEALPEVDKMVLVKRKSDAPLPYDLAQYDGSCWIDSWCGLIIDIIGWREIHE